MPTLIAGAVAVILLYSLLQMFRAANPVVLARAIKIGGGVVSLAVAAFTGIKGELAVAIPLGIFGAGLLGWSPFGASGFGNFGGLFGSGAKRSPGQTSQVRSQFLDMTLDHDSGELKGGIVAGPNAGNVVLWMQPDGTLNPSPTPVELPDPSGSVQLSTSDSWSDETSGRFFLFFPLRNWTSISAPLTRTSSHRR